jgi:hypothetical protein
VRRDIHSLAGHGLLCMISPAARWLPGSFAFEILLVTELRPRADRYLRTRLCRALKSGW